MQITDLNKVINLFLVGSLTLVTILFLWLDDILWFYRLRFPAGAPGGEMSAAPVVLIGTLAALSVAMFLGCVIDGLTEVLFRKNLRRLTGGERRLKLLASTEQHETTEMCRGLFRELLLKSEKYRCLYQRPRAAPSDVKGGESHDGKDSTEKDKTFTSALFFRTAKPEHVSWLVQHHSVHILVSDYIVLSLLFAVVLPLLHLFRWCVFGVEMKILPLYILIPVVLSIYPLCYLAVDRWLYTYEIAYRNNILFLCEEAAAQAGRDDALRQPSQR